MGESSSPFVNSVLALCSAQKSYVEKGTGDSRTSYEKIEKVDIKQLTEKIA